MGAGGVPNRSVVIIYGRPGDLPTKGAKPNSRYDLYVNGHKIQSRWFDSQGKVRRNRDYKHQDIYKNHEFPHDHIWSWGNRGPQRNPNWVKPDYDNYN